MGKVKAEQFFYGTEFIAAGIIIRNNILTQFNSHPDRFCQVA